MTSLVVDASAIIGVLTVDPADIPELAGRLHDTELLNAPSLIDYEVLDVLRKMVARNDIDDESAEDSLAAFRDLRLLRHRLTDDASDRFWQLRHNASAYDASSVALAEYLGVPLVTAERRLAVGVEGLTSATIESYAAGA